MNSKAIPSWKQTAEGSLVSLLEGLTGSTQGCLLTWESHSSFQYVKPSCCEGISALPLGSGGYGGRC